MMEDAVAMQVAGLHNTLMEQLWTRAVVDRYLALRREVSSAEPRLHAVQAVQEVDVLFEELERKRSGAAEPLPAGG